MSCQKELEERYLNPDKNDASSIDKLFTRMLDDNRVRPTYWDISTIVNWHIGVYGQTVGFLNNEFVYQQNDLYIQERWNDFYRPSANGAGVVAHFREMEKLFGAMTTDEQKEWEPFLYAGRIFLFDHAVDMVDLWGDIPFSEAGMLNATGSVVYPGFDAATSVYATADEQLAVAASYFANAPLSDAVQNLFAQHDILLHGDGALWQRYANALRLRLLMRTSFVAESSARESVSEMLSDPEKYPLPGASGYDPGTDDVLLTPLLTYTNDLHAAFSDWTNYPAPYYLLENVFKPVDDPRIPVMFDKYGSGSGSSFVPNETYNGMPWDVGGIEQQTNLSKFAILDSATFLFNSKLPGVVMTVAEIDFLRAEAFERWGGGDATTAYELGVKHSIEFYYYLNSLNTLTRKPLISPSDDLMTEFLQRPGVLYEGVKDEKLKLIWTQKWAHFGFLQAIDAWSELRRTNYPKLDFRPASLSGFEMPPARLLYPSSEKTYNPFYAAVQGRDLRFTPIFWDID